MAENSPIRVPERTSAPGDFYVETECCTSCGVPQVAAPDLVGWTDGEYPVCRWIKQPSTPTELEQAFSIFDGQELGCHRYAGTDPEIQKRVGSENCDHPVLPWAERLISSLTEPAKNVIPVRLPKWLRKRRK
jgi:hypothetical protein